MTSCPVASLIATGRMPNQNKGEAMAVLNIRQFWIFFPIINILLKCAKVLDMIKW